MKSNHLKMWELKFKTVYPTETHFVVFFYLFRNSICVGQYLVIHYVFKKQHICVSVSSFKTTYEARKTLFISSLETWLLCFERLFPGFYIVLFDSNDFYVWEVTVINI